jgi:hypothetical protein
MGVLAEPSLTSTLHNYSQSRVGQSRGRNNGRFLEWKGALLGYSGVPGKYLFPLPGLSQLGQTLLETGDNPMQEGAGF